MRSMQFLHGRDGHTNINPLGRGPENHKIGWAETQTKESGWVQSCEPEIGHVVSETSRGTSE